jgi:hypothetical protein
LKAETTVFKNEKLQKINLRFVDAMIYAPVCTIDQFTHDYTDKKVYKREKNFFLYEAINIEN